MSSSRRDGAFVGSASVLVGATLVTLFAALASSLTLIPVVTVAVLALADHMLSASTLRHVAVTGAPASEIAPAAQRVSVEVSATWWGGRLDLAFPGGSAVVAHGSRRRAGRSSTVELTPGPIEVLAVVPIDTRCTWFGLASARRRAWCVLDRPLYRVPAITPAAPALAPDLPDDAASVRAYLPGDRPSRINWAATARTGTMQVRAAEAGNGGVTVVVDAGEDVDRGWGPADDAWLDDAASRLAVHVERGERVRLITRQVTDAGLQAIARDPSGTLESEIVDRDVVDRDELLRRLTKVVAGPLPVARHLGAQVIARPAPPEAT